MPRFIILPYKLASESAKNLRLRLQEDGQTALVPKNEPKSLYRWRAGDVLVNWGNSDEKGLHWALPPGVPIINAPEKVAIASNKLKFFEAINYKNNFNGAGVPIPEFTTDKNTALSWLLDGHDVVVRKKLNGHSGEGIEILNYEDLPDDEEDNFFYDNIDDWIPDAPLYTKYLKKAQEYRVHVAFDEVIDSQRKAVRPGFDDPNWKVRNLEGGFIYTRGNFELTNAASRIAVAAVKACGLDFGAVDIIWNKRSGAYTVLEINTAPGLTGSTTSSYSFALCNEFAALPRVVEDNDEVWLAVDDELDNNF